MMGSTSRVALALVALLPGARSLAGDPTPDYLPRIDTQEEFLALSVPFDALDRGDRVTKFLLPLDADDDVGPLFHNVGRYPFHHEFLAAVFSDEFPALTIDRYLAMIQNRDTRRFFAGPLIRLETGDGRVYGFDIIAAPDQLPTREEARRVQQALDPLFGLGLVHYAPLDPRAIQDARGWRDVDFPIHVGDGEEDLVYEPYTRGVGYGRIRVLTHEEFLDANESGLITWQDMLVLERAPTDIEGVFAGVLTAERQGPLSHVSIRTNRRGTPNAFVANALAELSGRDGQLVRLEVRQTGWDVRPAAAEEAEDWWEANRPSLPSDPTVDETYARLDSLEDLDLDGETPPVSRYGGKATNLARLGRIFDGEFEEYRESGFAIPMRHYLEFLRTNHIEVDGERRTYEEHLDVLRSSPRFASDSRFRYEALAAFRREARDNGDVSIILLLELIQRVEEIFGSRDTMVRFRSSSNVEDLLEFNGAGLYDSTSACAADHDDDDNEGPSRCDENRPGERTIGRALKRVWTSLWTFRAHEERAYYQIPQDDVAMGILVTRAFLDEEANGVAFTGNPSNPRDRRYVVTSQQGETSVVHPDPGVLPEQVAMIVDRDSGLVLRVDRSQRSSLVEDGVDVLSDAKLGELANVMAKIDRDMPLDLGGHSRDEVLFDLELKVEAGGDLAIKQVRPFLLSQSPPQTPGFRLEIPDDTVLCGLFVEGRPPHDELLAKSRLRLRPGTIELPTDVDVFLGDLIEEIVRGPDRRRAEPTAPGVFHVTTNARGDGTASHTFRFEQDFTIAGEPLHVEINGLTMTSSDGEPDVPTLVLDEEAITRDLFVEAIPSSEASRKMVYSSCTFGSLPPWDVRTTFADGTTLRLTERFRPALAGTAPASVVHADVEIGGEQQETDDYFRLVYTALHHNFHVRYWIVLDPPVALPGVGTVHAIDLREPQSDTGRAARAEYLGASFEPIGGPRVATYWKGPAGDRQPGFRRGDTNADDGVNVSDVVFLLGWLFRATESPACPDAGDFDDDGAAEITDAILILSFLFQGVDLSAPPGPYRCGPDPTNDFLDDCERPCP